MSYFICSDCGKRHDIFSTGGAQKEAAKLNIPFLGEIPLEITIRQTSDSGEPIITSDPENKHAKTYFKIAQKIWGNLTNQEVTRPQIIID